MTKEGKRATQISFEGLRIKGQPMTVSPASASNKLHKSGGSNDQENLRSKRASVGHESSRKALRGQPKNLQLPNIVRTGDSVAQPLIIRNESPWNTMKEVFTCDLAGPVTLVVHRTSPSQVLAVREYSQNGAKKVLQVLQQPQHPNITSATDVFQNEGKLYTIGVDFHLTLDHLVACDVFPCELQLASILAQVVNGLSYILTIGLEHQAIECSNILLGLDGRVQIAALEHCVERRPDKSQAQSLSALTVMTMLLMQKYAKADGAIGIDDINRWPVESESVQFLSTTTLVATIEDLKEQPLFTERRWSPGELIGLARLSLISTHTFILK